MSMKFTLRGQEIMLNDKVWSTVKGFGFITALYQSRFSIYVEYNLDRSADSFTSEGKWLSSMDRPHLFLRVNIQIIDEVDNEI